MFEEKLWFRTVDKTLIYPIPNWNYEKVKSEEIQQILKNFFTELLNNEEIWTEIKKFC